VRVLRRDWMEGSESTVKGRVSMPWAARVVREEVLRAVAKTRRLWAWKARARECPMPPGEQLVWGLLAIVRQGDIGQQTARHG
jgi:hypothetical protein